MNLTCDKVQTAVAVEATLSEAEKAHIVACDKCGMVYQDYLALKALVLSADFPVPNGFSDKVMSRIEAQTEIQISRPAQDAPWRRLTDFTPIRWASFGIGGTLSAAGLLHFVFSVLIPS